MRIGELADLVGVTPRAVRHYHRLGLLPEPSRRSNGYRVYTLRDALALSRIRCLVALGMSLDEVRDALADGTGKDLVEILAALDTDLARQEEDIRRRRARLGVLIAQAGRTGRLSAEAVVAPGLAALLDDTADASSATAARERELLALLGTGPHGDGGAWLTELEHALAADPDAVRRVHARMDELAGAAEDDPRVEEVARDIAGIVPDTVARALRARDGGGEGGFADAFFAEYAPAQAAVVRRAVALLTGRAA
ncbi:MerR family transcriptional regulator [Streptomyces avicenniae]|uniref:MerR family transcriptional regulator n=1 Tax=Streptomyces avicenniae TaxID=500153 RepID=UPI00069C28C1|nr:MerR family transcriptional regulator [Streptomyces avicenniae]